MTKASQHDLPMEKHDKIVLNDNITQKIKSIDIKEVVKNEENKNKAFSNYYQSNSFNTENKNRYTYTNYNTFKKANLNNTNENELKRLNILPTKKSKLNTVNIHDSLVENIKFELNNLNLKKDKIIFKSQLEMPKVEIPKLSSTNNNFNHKGHFKPDLPVSPRLLTERNSNSKQLNKANMNQSLHSIPMMMRKFKRKDRVFTVSEKLNSERYRKHKVNLDEILIQYNSTVRRDMNFSKISEYHLKKSVKRKNVQTIFNKSLDVNIFSKSMNIVNIKHDL